MCANSSGESANNTEVGCKEFWLSSTKNNATWKCWTCMIIGELLKVSVQESGAEDVQAVQNTNW